MTGEPGAELLRIEGVSKRYGAIPVLHDITLSIPPRSIVGLVGENGAGKSTLFNIVTGLATADTGTMRLKGEAYRPQSFAEAFGLGVTRVFQEQALVANIPVYENLVLSQEHRFARLGQFLDKRSMIAVAERIVEDAGLDVDVRRMTSSYDFSKRQAIEIARACLAPRHLLGIEAPLVLLDEPTSALDREDETAFFDLLLRLKAQVSFIFVSHRLSEVRALSDAMYVMRDGRLSERLDPKTASETVVYALMVGREQSEDYYHVARQQQTADRPVVCDISELNGPGFADISFAVRQGEIVGFGGLLDSGKSAMGKALAGVTPPRSGSIGLAGETPEQPRIARLIRKGLGYVPAERLVEGIIASLSLAINLTLPSEDRFSRFGVWRLAREKQAAERAVREMGVRSGSPAAPLRTLSGGNQQKVVLARWLQRDLKLLVLDNPTRGVDAGAKEEIYAHIRRLTEQGVGIVLITDELIELIGLSNRILIMQRGRIVTEIAAPAGAKPTEHNLIPHMLPSAA
jgi:ribose transport system ATP-binding protein